MTTYHSSATAAVNSFGHVIVAPPLIDGQAVPTQRRRQGPFNPTFGLAQSIPSQLDRQYEAAVAAGGIPVEWRVAEPRVAAAIEAIIEQRGYGDLINVVVVPPAS
ncbi:hypothetical protein [Mycobacterium branderi]|uniref:Uncharacterized protein n=1 Tax=Mycobacterium branderi TaxID=43348 RepID=A0ABM7KV69_9MYCO|nr:hypothetical protein [Mycobacterium branderi]BBZ15034.1 hypothetical protein MBRA_52290 [Mycobacterium branderi]